MKKSVFFQELQEALEFEDVELQEETNLRAIEGFDSLAIMTIIAFVDEHFQKKLTAQQLASVTTTSSLMGIIGSEHFED